MGGFPPIIKIKDIKIENNRKGLKPLFFSTAQKSNVNIRQILSNKKKILDLEENEELFEINEL